VAAAKTVTFAAAHVALEGGSSRLRVRDEALARGGADEDAAVVIHADHGRGEDAAEGVFDELRLAVLPVGDKAVGGAEVNAEDRGVHIVCSKRENGADYIAGGYCPLSRRFYAPGGGAVRWIRRALAVTSSELVLMPSAAIHGVR